MAILIPTLDFGLSLQLPLVLFNSAKQKLLGIDAHGLVLQKLQFYPLF